MMTLKKRFIIFLNKNFNKLNKSKMFKSFLKLPKFRFSAQLQSVFVLKYKVKDVTKLRGVTTETSYIMIEGQKILIPRNKLVGQVMGQSPFYKPNEPIRIGFLDAEQNLYMPTCPSLALLENSFYVRLNNQLHYVANQQPLVKSSMNAEYIATDAPPSLQPIVEEMIKEVDQVAQYITPGNLNTLLTKTVMDQAIVYKKEKIRLKQLLKIVESRIQEFDRQIEAINEIVSQKAINKTRLFSTFMIAQYAIIHYFIYFHLSWDIMEPITVILTNLDILIGYYFFVFKGREYSLEELQRSMEEKQKYQYLKKYKFNLEKYQQLLELRDIFKLRLDLYSKSPYNIMDRLEKPLRMLDTR